MWGPIGTSMRAASLTLELPTVHTPTDERLKALREGERDPKPGTKRRRRKRT